MNDARDFGEAVAGDERLAFLFDSHGLTGMQVGILRKIKRRRGCRTPGLLGEEIRGPEQLARVIPALNERLGSALNEFCTHTTTLLPTLPAAAAGNASCAPNSFLRSPIRERRATQDGYSTRSSPPVRW